MNFTRVGERTPTKSDFTSSVKQAKTGVPGVKFNVCILLSSAFFFSSVGGFPVVHSDISTPIHNVDSLLQHGSTHSIYW